MADLPIPVAMRAGGVNREYEDIFNDLVDLIPHYTSEWTYTGEDDFGIVLLQLMAYLGDHLHYRADTTIRDLRAASTVDKDILENLADWIGYRAKRKSAAYGTVVFTLEEAQASDVTIPRLTQVRAPVSGLAENETTAVVFETTSEVVIPAGGLTATVEVVEGETQNLVSLGTAHGGKYERFEIDDPEAIFSGLEDDLTIVIGSETATLVRWAALSTSDQLTYWVRSKSSGNVEIRFGNGSFGRRLNFGDEVLCTYRSGGGETGLVASNAITELVSGISLGGDPIAVSVTNPQRTLGGSEVEDIEDLRVQAPAYFRTQNRAVTLEDYKTLCLSFSGVFRANPVRVGINGVLIYVVADNATFGSTLTDEFVSRVLTGMDEFRMATDVVDVTGADLIPIDVHLSCFAFPAQRNAAVRRRVLERFTDADGILSAESNDVGQHLRRSDMVNIVEDVEGMDYVDVPLYTRRPELKWVYATGNATLDEDGVTIGPYTVEEKFTLVFLSATTFSVHGSVTGLQTPSQGGTGTLGAGYAATDAGNLLISFKVNAGSIPMALGDRASISVSKMAENIQLGPNEFPVAGAITIDVQGGVQ